MNPELPEIERTVVATTRPAPNAIRVTTMEGETYLLRLGPAEMAELRKALEG